MERTAPASCSISDQHTSYVCISSWNTLHCVQAGTGAGGMIIGNGLQYQFFAILGGLVHSLNILFCYNLSSGVASSYQGILELFCTLASKHLILLVGGRP